MTDTEDIPLRTMTLLRSIYEDPEGHRDADTSYNYNIVVPGLYGHLNILSLWTFVSVLFDPLFWPGSLPEFYQSPSRPSLVFQSPSYQTITLPQPLTPSCPSKIIFLQPCYCFYEKYQLVSYSSTADLAWPLNYRIVA